MNNILFFEQSTDQKFYERTGKTRLFAGILGRYGICILLRALSTSKESRNLCPFLEIVTTFQKEINVF